MQLEEVKRQIEEINAVVLALSKRWEWFDFQFSLIQEGIIKLEGSFDLTALYKKYDKIEIEFSDPFSIKTILFDWEWDKSKSFIELVNDEYLNDLSVIEDIKRNQYYVFKINANMNEPIIIIAKSIKYSSVKANEGEDDF